MPFKTLKEAFKSPKLTISSLQIFKKEHLQSHNSIYINQTAVQLIDL